MSTGSKGVKGVNVIMPSCGEVCMRMIHWKLPKRNLNSKDFLKKYSKH